MNTHTHHQINVSNTWQPMREANQTNAITNLFFETTFPASGTAVNSSSSQGLFCHIDQTKLTDEMKNSLTSSHTFTVGTSREYATQILTRINNYCNDSAGLLQKYKGLLDSGFTCYRINATEFQLPTPTELCSFLETTKPKFRGGDTLIVKIKFTICDERQNPGIGTITFDHCFAFKFPYII